MNIFAVAKFGGTSMAHATAMKLSADIIGKNPKIKLVVVSATSGTSNQLIEIYNELSFGNKLKAEEMLNFLQQKHTLIAKDLGCIPADSALRADANSGSCSNNANNDWQGLESLFQKMRRYAELLMQAIETKNSTQIAKYLDQFLSIGEEMSAYLFVLALGTKQIPAEFFDVKKVLLTDDNFGKAEPILSLIAENTNLFLKPHLNNEKVIVVQGFVGATQSGEITTLGRGGSDFSAALLAEGLHADELQIWTDVAGIMTMDPNLVKTARIIPKMSFEVAAELANFGAKVLHPATLWPAMRQNIKTFVGSTFSPELGGTWIYPEHQANIPIHAIALRKKQILITITSLRMLNAHGFLAKIFGILATNKLSVDLVTTSEVSVALTIDENSLSSSGEGICKYSKMLDEMKEFCQVTIEESLTLVAIIGTDLLKTPRLNARAFGAIKDYNVRLICHGASHHNLCFLVDAKDAKEVVHHLHQEFIENNEDDCSLSALDSTERSYELSA